MRVEARHCNPAAQCHGGMLATFADMVLPYTAMYDLGIARRFTPTVSLQTDFVAPVGRGSWLEGLGTVVRSTRTLLFVQGLLFVGAEVVARASGIYKWGDPVAPAGDDPRDPFGLRPAPR
ncbi:PaaI family thioesterase [Piscinibacter sakaiensis]